MSSLSSGGPSASPVAAASPGRKPANVDPKTAAAGADGAAGSAPAGGKKTNSSKGSGKEDGGRKKRDATTNGAPLRSATGSKKPKKSGAGAADTKAASAPVSKAAGAGADGGGVSQGAGGSKKLKGGGAASSEVAGGPDKRRKNGEDLLGRLDARVFRLVEAGACREEGCEVRDEPHCHRGPGCDCTRWENSHETENGDAGSRSFCCCVLKFRVSLSLLVLPSSPCCNASHLGTDSGGVHGAVAVGRCSRAIRVCSLLAGGDKLSCF